MSLRLVELTPGWSAALDVAAWAVLSVGVGYAAHRLPTSVVAREHPLTRLRRIEADGRWYERRWRIRRWKHLLPEGGDIFEGGWDKGRLHGRDDADLERFVAETRRAELAHWALLACGPAFVLWNPPALAAVMVAYAVVANVPCLVTQRYNRARLLRILDRRSARRARPSGR